MSTATINSTNAITDQMMNSGRNHFAHLIHDTLATAKLAINGPDVGYKTFENPSPNWNARTLTCLVIPIISASGVCIGIIIAACPLPEGTKKLKIEFITNIPSAVAIGGNADKG